jgi:hypothetical protein
MFRWALGHFSLKKRTFSTNYIKSSAFIALRNVLEPLDEFFRLDLMTSLIPVISKRGVRSLNPAHYRPPWPLVKKNPTGWRKIGPMFYERWKWPGQNREFGELHPSFQKLNPPQLHSMIFKM